ncbi:MAG TPA: hypothetical protein VLT33_41570 [Labilithrix sp.]|nr:hypothetical protein [Labilithrix sp.]
MQLLLAHPLWIVVIALTLALHAGFFFGVRRLLRDKSSEPNEPNEPNEPDER